MFITQFFTNQEHFIWWIIIAVFSVCLHELFHALAAYYEGDDTAKALGYFTLNPMVHMGPTSLILLLFTGLCWGACPVNPNKFRHAYGEALVSFAGPFANLLLMVVFAGLALGLQFFHIATIPLVVQDNLSRFCYTASHANAALFILNMIPLPPLDAHSIVANLIPGARVFYAKLWATMGYGLLVVLFMFSKSWLWLGASQLSAYSTLLIANCLHVL